MEASNASSPAEATSLPPPQQQQSEEEPLHVIQSLATTSQLDAATATGHGDDSIGFLSQGSDAATAAGATSSFAALTMQNLFGPMFHVEDLDRIVAKDPALMDTRSILQDLFGASVREDDVHLFQEERYGAEFLTREMKVNKDLLRYERGARYFGSAFTQALRTDQHVPFTLLESTLPPTWMEDRQKASAPSWLLDMPAIYPNRQTLHADPRPCDPSTCDYLESNKYMLYTPSNVLRWTVEEGGCNSNSRVVRWSDGSITLHVGNDVLTLLPSQEPTLHLLGEPLEVGKAGMDIEAMIASQVPAKHLSARLGEAASIEVALAQERRQREFGNRDRNLPYADSAMPPIDWARPRKGHTIQEEFVREEYENREKEMKRRIKEGRPMSLTEQLRLEELLQDHVTGATAEELQAEREDALRQASLKASQRAESRGVKRSWLDRDVGLQGGDMGSGRLGRDADPFLNDEEELEEGEVEEEGSEARSDSYERQLAEMYARNAQPTASAGGKRDRGESERKKVRTEHASERYAGLTAALRALLTQIPMNAEAFASVDGTLSFLAMEETPEDVVKTEVPKMLAEVATELPTVSTQRVKEELSALFPGV